jgi:photosystem II stability/assembly factor-like uncharacterized protein
MNKAEPNFSPPGTSKGSNPDPAAGASATSAANSFTGFSPSASAIGLQARWITFAAAILGILLVLAALAGAWWQAPRPFPNPQLAMFAPGNPDWWRYPLESNPVLRLPAIQGNLRGVHALEDGKVWVVGEGGLILHSADGGRDWRQQRPQPETLSGKAISPETVGAAWPGLISQANAAKAPSQEPNLGLSQGPRQQSIPMPEQNIAPNTLPDSKRAEPEPVQSNASPNVSPNAPPISPSKPPPSQEIKRITTPAVVKRIQKPVIKPLEKKPVAIQPATSKPAELPPPPDDVDLHTVFFQDAQRGWAAGDMGKVWTTKDGGKTWQAGFIGEHARIVQIFSDNGFVVAIGAEGRVFGSANTGVNTGVNTGANAGTHWQPFEKLPASPDIIAAMLGSATSKARQRSSGIHVTPAGFWQLGQQGVIRQAKGTPENWQTRASGTQASLHGIAFADENTGWVVGDAGVILHSENGGISWQAQSGGEAALAARRADAENRLTPAPWTWLALLLGSALLILGARRLNLASAAAQAGADTAGIAGLFVSDQPLKPGEVDHLGHARIARGLADFIRNRNTEPGLTLAVTGSWGSGKSSIMRLLEDDLKRAGFRPAWFNAWHHQQEGRQLASMFNTIRKQAVPAIHTPAAWRVRAALYWHRGWFYRLLALAIIGLILLGLFEAQDQKAPLTQLRQAVIGALMDARPVVITSASLEKLKKGGVLHPHTLTTLTSKMVWQPRPEAGEGCLETRGAQTGDCRFHNLDQLYASLDQEMHPVGLTDEEKQALADAAQHLGDTPRTMLGVLLGVLVIPLLLGKGLAVYGLNYLDLFKRLLPERGKVEGKEAVGTMENFRNEFCNLTQALDGRLVLFIDDLDRCDCATVREVLELVNYLVSVGQCFIVLGMAMEHVACCIEPKTPKQQTDGYAMQYLKKLVNIEVPVPKADLNGIRAMLENQSRAGERPVDNEPARLWAGWVLSLLVLAGITWGMQQTWTQWQPDATPKRFMASPASLPEEQPVTPTEAPVSVRDKPLGAVGEAETPLSPATERQGPIGLLPAMSQPTSLWTSWLSLIALAALISAAGWATRDKWLEWLHHRGILQAIRIQLGGAERKRDTPAFRAALESWHKVIVAGDPTPRGIKRFVNRVRFLAMMEQALESDQIPEGVLVGLAALHHAKVDWSAMDAIKQTASTQAPPSAETEGERTEPAFPLSLQDAIQEATQNTPDWPPTPLHIERFLHMVEFMHVR